MGLNVSHGCWRGSYSAFMRWRCEVAKAAGLPPLQWMEGFFNWTDITHDEASEAVQALGFNPKNKWASELLQAFYCGGNLPIKWECLRPSPLHLLLIHSDCDGEIKAGDCAEIADAMEALLPKMPDGEGPGHIGNWRDKTKAFICGLRRASHIGENVVFG